MLGRNWIESPWGRMLVVFETKPCAFVKLCLPDSSEREQLKTLEQKNLTEIKEVRFPKPLLPWVKRIEKFFTGDMVDFSDIPTDLRFCTDFQARVLRELKKIPYGETRSYGEIAGNLQTKGHQAVGSAVGSNPLPLVIPCHRVLGRARRAGGFSSPGGLKTKEKLLRLEGVELHHPVSFFDSDFDLRRAKRELLKLAPELSRMMKIAPDFNPGKKRPEAPLRALAKSIVYQQLSGKAAATIWSRVTELCGKDLEHAPGLSIDQLRAAGLSQNKALALSELAVREIPSLSQFKKMTSGEIIAEVSSYRGLGAWSAQMFLIFNLGRMDVFAPADLGLQKGRALIFDFEFSAHQKELEQWAKAYAPWRTLLSWYLWRSLEF